jgi:hypothetical protein
MLPRAIANALQLPKLEAGSLIATKWCTTEEKAKFGNHLLRFIAEDHPPNLWTNIFYNRLSMTFSNIAHTNKLGFWEAFFENTADYVQFLQNIARRPCWGQPAYTYSDVEQIIRARVKKSGIIEWQERLLAAEGKYKDLAELARLKSICEQSPAQEAAPFPAGHSHMLTQTDLFV